MQIGNYIAGQWQLADSDKTIVDINPADTRDMLAEIPSSGEAEVDAALEAAARAFPQWRQLPFPQRLEIVARAHHLLDQKRDAVAQLLTRENGKTFRESQAEISSALCEMEFQMHHAERWGGPGSAGAAERRSCLYGTRAARRCCGDLTVEFPAQCPRTQDRTGAHCWEHSGAQAGQYYAPGGD